MCAESHPGQLCFEAAIAQSREISWLVLGRSLRMCRAYLPQAFDSWCILGCVHWILYCLGSVFLVWASCCVSVSCTDLAFSKDDFSMHCGHKQGVLGDSSVPPCLVDVRSVQVTLCWALFCPAIWGWSCRGCGLFIKPSPSPSLPQTSTAMGSSATTSCTSFSRKPTCLFLGTKWERSSRSSWSTVTRIKMGRLVLKSLSM